MKTIPIKSIKPWFIGVIAALALLAGSAPAVAQLFDAASTPAYFCEDSVSTNKGTVTLRVDVVDADGELVSAADGTLLPGKVANQDAFCAEFLNDIGDYDGSVDAFGEPTEQRECTKVSYKFSVSSDGQPAALNAVSIAISSLREVHFVSPVGSVVGNIGAGGLFSVRLVSFLKPVVDGDITTDKINELSLVSALSNIEVGSSRKKIKVNAGCGLWGQGGSINAVPQTTAITTACHRVGGDNIVSASVRRNPQGDILGFPNGVVWYFGNPSCKNFDPDDFPDADDALFGFPGAQGVNRGRRSVPGSQKPNTFGRAGGQSPTLTEFTKKDGSVITICYDLDNWQLFGNKGSCNPFSAGFDPETAIKTDKCKYWCDTQLTHTDGTCIGAKPPAYRCLIGTPNP